MILRHIFSMLPLVSPSRPDPPPTKTYSPRTIPSSRTSWSFLDDPLTPHTFHHPLQPSLHNYTPDDHLAQRGMQRLKVENQVQFADILKETVECFDEDLYEV